MDNFIFWIVASEMLLLVIFILHFQLFKLKTRTQMSEISDKLANVDTRLSADFATLKAKVDAINNDPNKDQLSPTSQASLDDLGKLADAMDAYLNPNPTTTGGPDQTNTDSASQQAQP